MHMKICTYKVPYVYLWVSFIQAYLLKYATGNNVSLIFRFNAPRFRNPTPYTAAVHWIHPALDRSGWSMVADLLHALPTRILIYEVSLSYLFTWITIWTGLNWLSTLMNIQVPYKEKNSLAANRLLAHKWELCSIDLNWVVCSVTE
jgi:hypothetical protein